MVTEDETFLGRTRNVGKMTFEQADFLGAIGPTGRASGVQRDVRVDSPYAGYPQFPVKVVTATAGDLEARFVVRIEELYESYRLVREIIDHLPEVNLLPVFPAASRKARPSAGWKPRAVNYFISSKAMARISRNG